MSNLIRTSFAASLCLGLWVPAIAAEGPQTISGAVTRSSMVVAADGSSPAEQIELDRSLAARLLEVGLEKGVRLEDWPVAPAVRRTVLVTRHDVYASDARIVKVEGGREIELPRSSLRFFWGEAETDPYTRVLVVVDPSSGAISGIADSLDGVHELRAPSGASRAQLLAPESSFFPGGQGSFSCGQDKMVERPAGSLSERPASATTQAAITSLHTATIAVDTDNELLLKKFADDTTKATNYLAQLFAGMNVMYERDVLVRLVQGQTYLRPSTTPDPYSQGAASTADGLYEFGEYWRVNYANVTRALAMMLSGKQTSGFSASGVAWVDALCEKGIPQSNGTTYGGYSFTRVFNSPTLGGSADVKIVGHELGHNFGSRHTHCYPTAAAPIDQCWNGEADRGCWAGPQSCPAPGTYQGVADVRGTVMSYCHLIGSTCSSSSVFHPETIKVLQPLIQSVVGACVIPLPTLPTVAIDDRTVGEGSAVNAAFRVFLSGASTSTVTVQYATANNTALAGSDYTTMSGTLTFTPGRTQASVFVPITTDMAAEGSESFFVNLSAPVGATLATKSQGIGTIQDPPAAAKSAMYRSYNKTADYHFFTTDLNSKNFAVGTLGYQDESTPVPFYVWNTLQTGTTPLFRMYNPNLGRHFYTASSGSRDFIASIGGVYEKEEGFVFPLSTSPVPSGATELFLLYNNNSGTHLFTADANTKSGILSMFPGIWVQHTSVGYVFTAP